MTREELEQYVKENDLVIWSRELSDYAMDVLKKAKVDYRLYCDRDICARNESCMTCEVTRQDKHISGKETYDRQND